MDFTAVHVHFRDLQPFCNSLKISNHNHKNSIKWAFKWLSLLFQSDYRLPVPNYNTLWEARDWLGMPGDARIQGGGGGAGGLDQSENHTLYG